MEKKYGIRYHRDRVLEKLFGTFAENFIQSPQDIPVQNIDDVKEAMDGCGLIYLGSYTYFKNTHGFKNVVNFYYRAPGLLGFLLDRVQATVHEYQDGKTTAAVHGVGRVETLRRVQRSIVDSKLPIAYENFPLFKLVHGEYKKDSGEWLRKRKPDGALGAHYS